MGVIAINDHVRTSGQSHKVTHHTQNNDSPTAGWFFPSGCPLFAVCILPPLFAAGSKNLPGMALAAVFVASLGAWGGELPANEAIVGVIRVQALSSTLVRVRISPHPVFSFFFLFFFFFLLLVAFHFSRVRPAVVGCLYRPLSLPAFAHLSTSLIASLFHLSCGTMQLFLLWALHREFI
jgi:hypothetical protein